MVNPMQILMQAMQNKQDPMQMLSSLAQQNPQARQVMQIVQGKSPEQLRQTVENMARERGTTVDELARRMGLK